MKITVCDDEIREVDHLMGLCKEYILSRSLEAEIKGVTKWEELEEDLPDILVLDIEMPDKTGIEIKNYLSKKDRPLILFATSYEETMSQAFGRNVIGFMTKPIEQKQFEKQMDCAVNLLSLDQIITFEDGSAAKSSDIVLITTDGKYTEAVFSNGEKKKWIRKSLNAWEEALTEIGFLRISKSYLINYKYIKKFEGDAMFLIDGNKYNISRRRRTECFERYKEFNRKSARFA